MKSIAEIFDNSTQMIDSIHNFFDRYIGNDQVAEESVALEEQRL